VLQLGLNLLKEDTDSSRRLAMISIDNAVELTIRTFLHLPKRVTRLNISRKDREGAIESFPDMVKALEEHASDRLGGVDLGELEWFHGLRNTLYHNGNGITIGRATVHSYAEVTRLLFANLLDVSEEDLPTSRGRQHDLLFEFYTAINDLTFALNELNPKRAMPTTLAELGASLGEIDAALAKRVAEIAKIRNALAHARPGAEAALTRELVDETRAVAWQIRRLASERTAARDTNEDHYRPNVRGLAFSEYDHIGTLTLRTWREYWLKVLAGTTQPNPGDTREEAPEEVRKLSMEIDAREGAGYAGPNRDRRW
jgi:hypothetical protein